MAEDQPLINLKILSPSTEVHGDISLPAIPASTTVKELRARLQNEITSKPATERMRLIYRGRVVANETDTLTDVFGSDSIRESKDHTLHLVLRELPSSSTSSSPTPRSSTAPPNPFRPGPQPGPVQNPAQTTNPFRPFPQARPNSQPQLPHQHHHHHHPHVHHHHHLPPQPNGLPPFLPPGLVPPNLPQVVLNPPRNPTPDGQPTQSRSGTPASNNGSHPPASEEGVPRIPSPSNLQPNSTTTVRHEAVGPNGERWTITRTNANFTIGTGPPQQVPVLPRPFPHPPGFPLHARPWPVPGNGIDGTLARARAGLQTAQQELNNVRVLFRSPNGELPTGPVSTWNVPTWRIEHVRQHIRNLTQGLDQVQHCLTALLNEPSMTGHRDVGALQQSAGELSSRAEELNRLLDRINENVATGQQSPQPSANPTSAAVPGSSTAQAANASQASGQAASSAAAPSSPEFFILSSPQGPVGVLFDQRGIYSTGAMLPTMPFQAFTQQFAHNRQLISSIGQQFSPNATIPQYQAVIPQPTPTTQPPAGAPAQPDQAAPAPAAQNQNANPAQPVPANENDRLNLWAGHAWLILKLLVFVYLFAGHGGWYRPAMMGLVAAAVYLAQIGLFEAQFNRIRHHFEALLPHNHPHGHPQPGNGQQQQQQNQGAQHNQHNQQRGQQHPPIPDRNLTPEQAAQRLLQQHQNQNPGWLRQSLRTTERAFAIFVASLWPGVGERMVAAQEERIRAIREAEEEAERRRIQEEEEKEAERARREAGEGSDSKGESGVQGQENGGAAGIGEEGSASASFGGKGKGKEKVEVADEGHEDVHAAAAAASSSFSTSALD